MEESTTDVHSEHQKASDFLLYISVCVVLPTVTSIFVYYGFITNYSELQMFSEVGFERQYGSNFNRYRVLGKALLIELDRLLGTLNGPMVLHGYNFRLGNPVFYSSYFLLNTGFLLITMSLLWCCFAYYATKTTKSDRMLWLILCLYCMTVTQYVVLPDDLAADCLLVLSILLILRYEHTLSHVGLIGIVIVLGTLTRETEALAVSFFLAVYVLRNGFRWTPAALGVILAGAFLLSTYIGLWAVLGSGAESAELARAFLPRSKADSYFEVAASYLFFLSLMVSVVIATKRVRPIVIFQILSLPYTFVVLLGHAFTFEARIWVPLVIPTIVLGTVDAHRLGLVDAEVTVGKQPRH